MSCVPVDPLRCPHSETRRLLATGAPVYLPVNPQEFHGLHLPLHNDALVSRGLAADLHARLAVTHPEWPFLVVPDLGVATGTVPGAGSRPVPYGRLVRLVREACQALAALGARRVVLMTFHGDPLHNLALEDGARLLRARGVQTFAPTHLLLHRMLRLDGPAETGLLAHIDDPEERAAMAEELALDFHAGFGETSLTLHYAPEAVAPSYRDLPPCPPIKAIGPLALLARGAGALGNDRLAIELAYASRILGWFLVRPFPGYTGRPHLASAAAGAHLAKMIVDEYAPVAESVFAGGPPPSPVMPWLAAATLGGRIGY